MILSCGNEAGMHSQLGPPGPKTSAKWKIDRSISIVALKIDRSHTTSDEYCGPGLSTLFWERGDSSELSENLRVRARPILKSPIATSRFIGDNTG